MNKYVYYYYAYDFTFTCIIEYYRWNNILELRLYLLLSVNHE